MKKVTNLGADASFIVDGDKAQLVMPQDGVLDIVQAPRLGNAVWQWIYDSRGESTDGYLLDDPEKAYEVVYFWERGTASGFERRLIETYNAGDTNMKTRLALLFPALCKAIDEWKSNNQAFMDRFETEKTHG